MIYLDNAATTPVRQEALRAMLPYYKENYGNPSGIYRLSQEVKKEVERARKTIAKTLRVQENEIYFTSGGTESDNWALKAAVQMKKEKGKHIITTKMEHHAVLNTCQVLEQEGCEVTYLGVNEMGMISLEELKKAIRPDTILVSIMYANNEVGTIQPIRQIGEITKKYHILFHTDAVQAYGHLPIDAEKEGIDMLSASAHKLNGPKGTGFLYVKETVPLPPFIHGGGQEKGMRSGTENVAGIIGMAAASQLAHEEMEKRENSVAFLRDHLINRLLNEIPFSRLNGSRRWRLAGNCNISFQFIEGASLLVLLDTEHICASAGSACSAGSSSPSHVLKAMGIPDAAARGTLRLTLGYQNTLEEIDQTVDCIKKCVEKLREHSPEYEDFISRRKGEK